MAETKTKPTGASVTAFLKRVPDEARRKDCLTLVRLMKQVTKATPKMWGPTMVGFGRVHYVYDSGHEGDCFMTGFAPRRELTLYIMTGLSGQSALLKKLGKHKAAKSCLYIKRLEDVDMAVLKKLVTASVKHAKQLYA